MGSLIGSEKNAAAHAGLSLQEYKEKRASGLKKCYKCQVWKGVSEYNIERVRNDGFAAICKSCRSKFKGSGPSPLERQQMRLVGMAWCRLCESWLSIENIHRGLCKEHTRQEYNRYYKESGGPAIRERIHARKRGIDPIPETLKVILLELFKGKCAYCQVRPATTWDHIVPVARGGQTLHGNMAPACLTCNSSKKQQDLLVWMKAKGYDISQELLNILEMCIALEVDDCESTSPKSAEIGTSCNAAA